MPRANRNFGDDGEIRGVHNFNPGGNDFGVIRQGVDGRDITKGGIDAVNVHQPSGGDPGWDDPMGETVECD